MNIAPPKVKRCSLFVSLTTTPPPLLGTAVALSFIPLAAFGGLARCGQECLQVDAVKQDGVAETGGSLLVKEYHMNILNVS